MNILKLQNVYFNYRKNKNNFYINNVNLEIESGDFITIVGPNGSGKSTLLKLIANILKPLKGEIFFNNKNFNSYEIKEIAQNIAFVQQSVATYLPFSILEIIQMGRTPYLNWLGNETKKDIDLISEAMERVEIKHLADNGINQVSGGEAQRAFIARALVQEPKILLLDEPSAHLDLHHQLSIYNLLKKLNLETGMTIIIVSHDLNLSGFYSEKTILMDKGQIVLNDITKNVLTSENINKYFGVRSKIEINDKNNNISVLIEPDYF